MSPLLEVQGVTKSFGGVTAVNDASWTAAAGAAVGIIGPNGAGKSTQLKLLAGVLRPDKGGVLFRGEPLRRSPHQVARAGIAMAHQTPRPFRSLSVRDNVRVALQSGWRRPSASAPPPRGAWTWSRASSRSWRTGAIKLAGTLSGGEQQMLSIGRALMTNPKLLICDELSLGLAPVAIESIYPALREIAAARGHRRLPDPHPGTAEPRRRQRDHRRRPADRHPPLRPGRPVAGPPDGRRPHPPAPPPR